ncbi:MAG: translation initiation factor eIF-1A [Candidatus Poseidoniaceae archaeon]|nr:translation initiation factor eIF-1A [Candidatus Poseidoniaceae archaeon]MDG1557427.1 translation initiation factor eIF-1A [Candidatus Poseidoniaceae archaeon]
MGRRREEKVDEEELARLESPEGSSSGKIRVKMPNKRVNEMFALAEQILGGRRVTVLCADGETRMARIPGKMRRRQWVRDGDLIIVWPWDFQDAKADVKHRYTKTQAMYLSRKGVLPPDVDIFGMNTAVDEDDEHDDLFGTMDDDDEDDLFGAADEPEDDDDDDLFGEGDDDDVEPSSESEEPAEASAEGAEASEEKSEEPFVVVEEYPSEEGEEDDDDDEDLEDLFG